MSAAPVLSTPSPQPQAQPLSEWQRLVNIFVSPGQSFTDLKRKPSWWVPWLIMSVTSLIFVFAVGNRIGWERITENQIKLNPKAVEQLEKLSPEERARRMEISATITKDISYATPVILLLVAAVTAGVLMGTFNFGMGAEISFAASMAVVMYSFLPGILKTPLTIISVLAGSDPEAFNIRNPVATNLGFFVDAVQHPALNKLASAFDIFAIWSIILMGIGYACVSKLKRSSTMTTVFVWYALITLAGVVIALF
ncbi:MAG TPA: YIP1 family protein [Terriglobales bacterium]|nr:YIP1 family protein [Terriglobales bacterium]